VEVSAGKQQMPSLDGKSPEVSGPRLFSASGKGIDKKTVIHAFLIKLGATGFPMAKFAELGAAALNGADVTMGALDKTYNIEGESKEKTYDVITEFHGFVGEAVEAAAEPVDESAAISELGVALLDTLQANNGEIPRGQLSIRLNKALKDNPLRVKLLGMVTKDEVLGQIEGITFDKKVVKLA